MVFRAICICLLLWFSESVAQQEHKRVLIGLEGSFNIVRDRELLSGEGKYDRTQSSVVGGITVAYSIKQEVGLFDPYVGATFSRMDIGRRYIATWPEGWYFLLPWENQTMGSLYTFSPFVGCRIWPIDEASSLPLTGIDLTAIMQTNWYEGARSEEFDAAQTVGIRLGLLARYPYFHINPFVQLNAVPSLERNYFWDLPSNSGPIRGSAISRHSRVLLGLQLGVCF
jgi:hypothetical protein